MAFDPVPWFVGGGAHHSPEVARLPPYALSGGAEGIVDVTDLRVTALPVAGAAVRVQPGAALIRSRAAGGAQQTYAARNAVAEDVPIAATGSSGGRSDLIVARVEDPFMAGESWQAPADPVVGPYVFARVVSNVPAGTTRLQDVPGYETHSAVTLARVDLPASTGTVTSALITDLRKVAIPRRETVQFMYDAPNERRFQTGTTAYDGWPLQGSDSLGLWDTVEIPEWATYYQCVVTYTGVKSAADTYGNVRLLVGSGTTLQIVGAFNTTNQSASEVISSIQAANKGTVPASMRGTTQEMRLQGRLLSTSIPSMAGPWATSYTRVVVQWDFSERPA